ncbi:TolC family protein [Chachezhania sediminis]|uniref:TolC family protein n=1 Tax=Chachezhania sediminis TaxID=2599291 RepID=UPI00131C6625|nr:TolC family protein [Chachezhania sediminis]
MERPRTGTVKIAIAAGVALFLAGCSEDKGPAVSSSPDQAWGPGGQGGNNFAVSGEIGTPSPDELVRSGKALDLQQLIDLGQRSHPATRIAWEEARQAAAAQGMVEGTFLPLITANVIGGYQDLVTPITNLQGGTDYISTHSNAVVPNIALQWLLFDFGERQAWRTAAKQNAFAANVAFNGTHQTLIYNISRAYYEYGAAQQNLSIAGQNLSNSQKLLEAAETRYANGLGTSIEVAQAKQIVAQARFRLVAARDGESDSYQDLLGAVGVSPRSQLKVDNSAARRLPRARALPTDQLIEQALSRRPDVLASYAGVKASEANEVAAEAAFRPKVYLGAVAAANNGQIQTGTLPGAEFQSTTTGVVVGASIPIYDGRIRENRRKQAQAATAAASAAHEQTVNAATREIIVASNSLQSSLASYEAATALRAAAQTTYDAAFEAYGNGLGTLTDVSAAENGLLDARLAQVDAHTAALIAASTLAFSLGNMTSRASPARAIQ